MSRRRFGRIDALNELLIQGVYRAAVILVLACVAVFLVIVAGWSGGEK